jgi:hypothetical protein
VISFIIKLKPTLFIRNSISFQTFAGAFMRSRPVNKQALIILLIQVLGPFVAIGIVLLIKPFINS